MAVQSAAPKNAKAFPSPTPDLRHISNMQRKARFQLLSAYRTFRIVSQNPKAPNARHHPPAGPSAKHEISRVAGRVHAVVRLRGLFSPSHVTPRRPDDNSPP